MKRMICLMMALLLMLGLCACGSEEAPATEPADAVVETPVVTTAATEDGKVTYYVTVTDEAGAPLSGVMVQICKDACLPGMTDASGTATFNVLEDDYKVSFLSLPAGYTYTTEETEFYFEEGSFEMTLTLKAE